MNTHNGNTNTTGRTGGPAPTRTLLESRLLAFGAPEEWLSSASIEEQLAELAGCTLRACILEADSEAFSYENHADSERNLEKVMLEVGRLLTARHAGIDGQTARVIGLDGGGIADESALSEAALLAELSEPDTLDELENLSARVGRMTELLARQDNRLEGVAGMMRVLLTELRASQNRNRGATFHLSAEAITVARLEQLLNTTPEKAAEVFDALLESGVLDPAGCLDVRLDLSRCEVER